jgi:hypothetical protein
MKKVNILMSLFVLFSFNATAQTFTTGYGSLVVFTDGHSTRPAGETEATCQENEARIVANYLAMPHPEPVAVDETRSLPCGPRTSTVPELDLEAWRQLPVPPVCLSCPLLGPDTFEIYYPGFETKIKDLYYQYNINQYNKEFRLLQQKYELQSFEKELFYLNNQLNLEKK